MFWKVRKNGILKEGFHFLSQKLLFLSSELHFFSNEERDVCCWLVSVLPKTFSPICFVFFFFHSHFDLSFLFSLFSFPSCLSSFPSPLCLKWNFLWHHLPYCLSEYSFVSIFYFLPYTFLSLDVMIQRQLLLFHSNPISYFVWSRRPNPTHSNSCREKQGIESVCWQKCMLKTSSVLLEQSNDSKKNYSSTLLLPKTGFQVKYEVEKEKLFLEKTTTELYRKQVLFLYFWCIFSCVWSWKKS